MADIDWNALFKPTMTAQNKKEQKAALSVILGPPRTRKLKKVKKAKKNTARQRNSTSESTSGSNHGNNIPTGGTGAPQITMGQFVFPMTTKPSTSKSKSKSASKHASYLTAGTIGPEEIKRRIQSFLDNFFKKHDGQSLTVNNLIDKDSLVDIYKFMKPVNAAVEAQKGEEIGSGGFGNTYQHTDPNKVIKVISIHQVTEGFSSATPADIIAELLIQYILQLDTERPGMVPIIYDIYYDKPKKGVWVIMEKMDKTIQSLFREHIGIVDLRTFKGVLRQILEMLVYLNDKYGFVHRDLKVDNIMVKEEKVMKKTLRGKNKEELINKVKFIDFGLSAMNFEGLKIGSSYYFKDYSPCRGRQDTTFLFVSLKQIERRFDEKVKEYLDEMLAPIERPIPGMVSNFNGKLLACPSTRILDPAKALRKLENTV